ncbi:tyrosine-protein phosphatase 10D-like [Mercenaria mercenaria]|uniref:tyrosine-protein phosphatase 10D-like n=1 Tax=Mercenaria mercenaria TaxID=6596 RepID=UPI00234F6329|nr:tyrosine-protein phosphatase 10D-like [Mercenaria mercenaria]
MDKGLGKACTGKPNECADSAAQCTGGKCTCGVNYYDSNGFTEGGNCLSVTNLQVTNVDFPSSSVKTNEITVTWSAPVNYNQYIDRYTVEWKRTHDSSIAVQSEGVASLGTSLTLTRGIESGRAYTVTIISINDQTQTSSERTTSVKKQQAAKPTVTSGLDWSNSDRDATTGTIKVAWVAAAGYISQYYVQLLDETTMINSKIVTSPNTHAEFPSSGLEDGYRYNVKITARSESYDSGKRVSGETFTAEFKTTPKIPDAPQNGVCKDPTDKSITLKWSKPADTKGDLVKYHIYVYQNYNTLKFIVSTAGTGTQKIVGNLEPGTSYTFRIYTENEMYNSSSSNNVTTGCKTKAKMSEAPTDLDITNVTSRSFDISWMKPDKTYSAENYGYVLQIKDDQDTCVTEIIYRCSNCTGGFQISNLTGLCSSKVPAEIGKTKQELEGQLTYPASLNPDIVYTVTVTAINDAGRGYPANETERTLEEAPQVPYNVTISEIGTTSLKVAWNIHGPRPGKTNFTIVLMADHPAATKDFTISGFDIREYVAQGLEEYWNYSVTVKAATSVDAKTSERTQEYTTKPAAPGEVSDFKITEAPGDNYTVMMISWEAPAILKRNSIIKSYTFEHYATGMVTTTKNFSQEDLEAHVYTVMLDVTPEEKYTLSVYAVNEDGQKGKNITREQTAPAGVPINIEDTLGVDIIPKNLLKNKEQRRFTISLVPEFFTEQTYGIPQGTGLAACAKNCDFTGIQTLQDFDSMDNWNKASVNGFELWRITNSTFLDVLKKKQGNSRRKRSTTQLDYTVGSDDCSQVQQGEYCNGPLQPGTSYTIVAVSCTSGGCLVSKEYGPFVTLAVPDEEDNLPMIIGIVVAVVVVVVIGAVVGFVLLKKKRSGPGKMKPASESDDDEFTTIDPAVAKIPRKRPIVLEEIEEYVNKMHRDSNLLFSAEYEDLKTLSPKHACEAADREENRMRNRYINIIPFDHTRVKLSTNGEDDSSDYINANYLPGYSSPREYIGCQGPIPGTIDDFWRMTWEQNVSVVVMLTLCKEGQKIKCEQYWPDEVGEPKQYGDVIVEITSYSNIRTYDYRMFKITNGSTTRVVKHFHFLSWLDFQANVHHDIILDFIEHVRQHVQPPDTSGPMIIHCSAGVGRTGTYIALDHLMQFINEHDFAVEIDIFDLVLKLRENRQHMVQTEQQYVFIHDCVKEIMDRKRRQIENPVEFSIVLNTVALLIYFTP